MGMFDYVRCEYPLPDLDDPTSINFQTKDTDAMYLHQYTITKEGRLVSDVVHYEDHSDPNAEGLLALAGCMTPVKDGEADTNFHGVLNFYGDKHTGEMLSISLRPENFGEDTLHPGPEPEWYEYNATFTHGTIEKVERVKP